MLWAEDTWLYRPTWDGKTLNRKVYFQLTHHVGVYHRSIAIHLFERLLIFHGFKRVDMHVTVVPCDTWYVDFKYKTFFLAVNGNLQPNLRDFRCYPSQIPEFLGEKRGYVSSLKYEI